MHIKGADGHDYAGVAGKGTTALGIIGTTLGGLAVANMANTGCGCNGNGGGILSNIFGGNGHCECYATKYDIQQSERIGALEAIIADQNAKMYADSVGISLYTQLVKQDKEEIARTNALFRETFDAIAVLSRDTAVNTVVASKNLQLLEQKVDYTRAIDRQYVDGTFVPGKLVLPLCSICPTPQVLETVEQPTSVCVS